MSKIGLTPTGHTASLRARITRCPPSSASDLGRRADERGDRDMAAVGEQHERVAGDALAQVRQDRLLLAAALLDATAELGEGDHRDVELARQALEPAADLAHLLDAALDPALVAHQLEVVDDDQAQAALDLVRAGGGTWRGPRARRCRWSRRRTAAPRPGAGRPRGSSASAARPPCPRRRSSPLIRAWEATKRWASSDSDISSENSATAMAGQHRVLGDVGHQRRLAHRGAGGEDDQVAGLEAAGLLVEVLEARRRAGERRSWPPTGGGACRSPRAGCPRSSGSSSGGRRVATSSTERSARSTSSRAGASRDSTLAWIS